MNVVVTENFKAEAKPLLRKFPSLLDEIDALIDSLVENPFQGEALGKDCFKIRLAIKSKGKGKSGGARVITCVKVTEARAYLLSIYDKSDKENISKKELTALLKAISK